MDNSDSLRRSFLPEWSRQQALLLVLPHEDTDWAYMLEEVHDCYRGILALLRGCGTPVHMLVRSRAEAIRYLGLDALEDVTLHEADYNDTWVRDYGPIAVKEDDALRLLDFGFNGWGLKFASDRDNLVNLNMAKEGFMPSSYVNQRDYVLEGGSVETDGRGTLLTTSRCLCSPNRNGGLTKREVEKALSHRLGIRRVLWLDHGALAGDDTDSHIDTLARMAPDDTIVYTGCADRDDEHFSDLQAMAGQLREMRTDSGLPYNLVELPLPEAIFDEEEGIRLPATYANYLITNNKVLVPAYGQPLADELARLTVASVFPSREAVSVDCRALIRQHGSLHCATMQIPELS